MVCFGIRIWFPIVTVSITQGYQWENTVLCFSIHIVLTFWILLVSFQFWPILKLKTASKVLTKSGPGDYATQLMPSVGCCCQCLKHACGWLYIFFMETWFVGCSCMCVVLMFVHWSKLNTIRSCCSATMHSSIGFVVASLPGWVLLVCEHKTQGLRSYPRCSSIWNDLPWAQGYTELLCHSWSRSERKSNPHDIG